jgi:hypothetical protein
VVSPTPQRLETLGASAAIDFHLPSILGPCFYPSDEFLFEQPAYGLLVDVALYLGARLKRLPEIRIGILASTSKNSSAPSLPWHASW